MPTAYTASLRLALPATGELNNTWGIVLNENTTSMIEQAISGVLSILVGDENISLTTADGTTDQARNAALIFTGTLTGGRVVTIPSVSKVYIVKNATTGGYPLTFSAGGIEVDVPQGQTYLLYSDGSDVFEVSRTLFSDLTASALTATLAADLDMGGFKGVNAGTPTSGTDLATKGYVDLQVITATAPSFTVTTTGINKTLAAFESCRVTVDGLTITLPATPVAGTTRVRVITGAAFVNTTVARNGNNIGGLAEDCLIPFQRFTSTWFYQDSTVGWILE